MGSVSKLFPGQNERINPIFFFLRIFFFDCPDPKTGNGSKKTFNNGDCLKRLRNTEKQDSQKIFCQVRFLKNLGLNGGWFPDSFFSRDLRRYAKLVWSLNTNEVREVA